MPEERKRTKANSTGPQKNRKSRDKTKGREQVPIPGDTKTDDGKMAAPDTQESSEKDDVVMGSQVDEDPNENSEKPSPEEEARERKLRRMKPTTFNASIQTIPKKDLEKCNGIFNQRVLFKKDPLFQQFVLAAETERAIPPGCETVKIEIRVENVSGPKRFAGFKVKSGSPYLDDDEVDDVRRHYKFELRDSEETHFISLYCKKNDKQRYIIYDTVSKDEKKETIKAPLPKELCDQPLHFCVMGHCQFIIGFEQFQLVENDYTPGTKKGLQAENIFSRLTEIGFHVTPKKSWKSKITTDSHGYEKYFDRYHPHIASDFELIHWLAASYHKDAFNHIIPSQSYLRFAAECSYPVLFDLNTKDNYKSLSIPDEGSTYERKKILGDKIKILQKSVSENRRKIKGSVFEIILPRHGEDEMGDILDQEFPNSDFEIRSPPMNSDSEDCAWNASCRFSSDNETKRGKSQPRGRSVGGKGKSQKGSRSQKRNSRRAYNENVYEGNYQPPLQYDDPCQAFYEESQRSCRGGLVNPVNPWNPPRHRY